jgi:hypothetical protein
MKDSDNFFDLLRVVFLIFFLLGVMVLISQPKAEESKTIFEPKYPSGVIYGFIEGCYLAFEDAQYKSDKLWPDDLKDICGCMMDGLREAVPAKDFLQDWGGQLNEQQQSLSNMFGMLCTEQIIRRKLQENKDPV